MADEPKNFFDYIQEHERTWGDETYKDRPDLEQIMKAVVVAFWLDGTRTDRYFITLHDDMKPIHEYYDTLIRRLVIGFPKKRLLLIFHKGREVRLNGIKLDFDVTE